MPGISTLNGQDILSFRGILILPYAFPLGQIIYFFYEIFKIINYALFD